MRFNRLMHPEVIEDKRGNEIPRLIYRTVLPRFHLIQKPEGVIIDMPAIGYEYFTDEVAIMHLGLCHRYLTDGGQCYYIPPEFLKALCKLDREVPIDLLPKEFIGYFQFPDNVLIDDYGSIEGAYVYIGPLRKTGANIGRREDVPRGMGNHVIGSNLSGSTARIGPDETVVALSYLNKRESSKDFWVIGRLVFSLDDLRNTKLSDVVGTASTVDFVRKEPGKAGLQPVLKDPGIAALRSQIYVAMINAVLYLHSEDPEIMRLRPTPGLTAAQKATVRKEHPVENQCTIPVTLLNWEYKGGRQYKKDGTFIDTFQRWQRCGEGLSKVKLIWVKEHIRHFPKHTRVYQGKEVDVEEHFRIIKKEEER